MGVWKEKITVCFHVGIEYGIIMQKPGKLSVNLVEIK